jgi:hypothetical protein
MTALSPTQISSLAYGQYDVEAQETDLQCKTTPTSTQRCCRGGRYLSTFPWGPTSRRTSQPPLALTSCQCSSHKTNTSTARSEAISLDTPHKSEWRSKLQWWSWGQGVSKKRVPGASWAVSMIPWAAAASTYGSVPFSLHRHWWKIWKFCLPTRWDASLVLVTLFLVVFAPFRFIVR